MNYQFSKYLSSLSLLLAFGFKSLSAGQTTMSPKDFKQEYAIQKEAELGTIEKPYLLSRKLIKGIVLYYINTRND